jgi:hypothetical protein
MRPRCLIDLLIAPTGRYLSAGISPYDAKFQSIWDEVIRLERSVESDIAVLRSEGNLHHSIFDELKTDKPQRKCDNKSTKMVYG